MVLDDAVVNHGHGPGRVRVGVDLAGPAVGRPARVTDAGRPYKGALFEGLMKLDQLAERSDDFNALAVVDGDARGVVTAVLELA